MRIAITGSIAYDYIMTYPGEFAEMLRVDGLDKISVSFLVDEMTRHPGGVAPNIAYTMALLGERPLLVGTAGQDFTDYRVFLEAAGIDTSGTRIHQDVFTASFFVSTDRLNNQIASFYTGAMARARDLTLLEAADGIVDFAIISPNDPEAMLNYSAECRAHRIAFMYDPGQQVARVGGDELAAGLKGAQILIINDVEQEALCRKTGMAHHNLLEETEMVIVTRGEHGADIYTRQQTYHIPIVPPHRIEDPTGVGDAFRGGFLKGIAAGWPVDISGRVGSLAATYVLEHRGTQSHRYTRQEFVERFRQHFDDRGILDEMLQSEPAA